MAHHYSSGKSPLKKYRVLCWLTYYGHYDVEARNEKEAEMKAEQRLAEGAEMDGTDNSDSGIADVQEL